MIAKRSGIRPRRRGLPSPAGTGCGADGGGAYVMAAVCPNRPALSGLRAQLAVRGYAPMRTVVPTRAQAYIHLIAAFGKCTQPCDPRVRYFGLPYGNFCHDESCIP